MPTIVVEDGTAKTNSNSYVAVTDVDAYHLERGNTAWAAATTTNKEIALIKATAYITHRFGPRFTGDKFTQAQALSWPRSSATEEGFGLTTNAIPTRLKHAEMEAAIRITPVGSEELLPDLDAGASSVTDVTVGPISVSYAEGRNPNKVYQLIEAMLQPLLKTGPGVVTLVRA